MARQSLDVLSRNQRERLVFIDFRLYFLGSVSRSQICERFAIAPAAATRDFSLYRNMAPANLTLDGVTKHYRPAENFLPLFDHPLDRVLSTSASGFGDGIKVSGKPLVPCDIPLPINHPDIHVLAAISRAISLRRALQLPITPTPVALRVGKWFRLHWSIAGCDGMFVRTTDPIMNSGILC